MANRIEHFGDATLYLCDCREVLPSLASRSVDFHLQLIPPMDTNNNNNDLIANWEKAVGRPIISKIEIKSAEPRPIANDGKEADDLVRFLFAKSDRLLSSGGCCCCCCGGGGPDPQFARWSLWLDEAVGFKQMVIWDKGPMGMGSHYRRSYKTVLVGEKRGGKCRWLRHLQHRGERDPPPQVPASRRYCHVRTGIRLRNRNPCPGSSSICIRNRAIWCSTRLWVRGRRVSRS